MVLRSAADYFKFLTTTKMTTSELCTIIKQIEMGMKNDNWQVQIAGRRDGIRKIRLILDEYPNGNGSNGNGEHNNGG